MVIQIKNWIFYFLWSLTSWPWLLLDPPDLADQQSQPGDFAYQVESTYSELRSSLWRKQWSLPYCHWRSKVTVLLLFAIGGSFLSPSPHSSNPYENFPSSKRLFWISAKKLPQPLQCCMACAWLGFLASCFCWSQPNVTGNKWGCSLTSPSGWAKCLRTNTAAWRSSLVSSFGLLLCVDTDVSTGKWDLMGEWSDFAKVIYV